MTERRPPIHPRDGDCPSVDKETPYGAIETDPQDPTREYIPIAGWEVQTKGRGSSYRLADVKNDERHNILGCEPDFIKDFVTRFAKDAHAEIARLRAELAAARADVWLREATLSRVIGEIAKELECAADNDEMLQKISRLRAELARKDAALVELREAAGAVIKSAEPVRGNDKTGARFIWKYSLEPKPFDALRAALEPRKEGGE